MTLLHVEDSRVRRTPRVRPPPGIAVAKTRQSRLKTVMPFLHIEDSRVCQTPRVRPPPGIAAM